MDSPLLLSVAVLSTSLACLSVVLNVRHSSAAAPSGASVTENCRRRTWILGLRCGPFRRPAIYPLDAFSDGGNGCLLASSPSRRSTLSMGLDFREQTNAVARSVCFQCSWDRSSRG